MIQIRPINQLTRYLMLIMMFCSTIWLNAQDIVVITSSVAANALEATPDTPDDNTADLRIQAKSGDTKIAFVKFDISSLGTNVESAGVRLYSAQHENETNGADVDGTPQRSIVTPYRVMMVPVAKTDWDASFTWNQIGGEGDDVLPRNVYRVSEANIIDFNKPNMGRKDSKYQHFGGPIIANYISERKAAGATEVAFAFIAMDSVDVHDAWMGGTWRNPELHVTEGNLPTKLAAADVAEIFEATPDSIGNTSDLRIQSSSGKSVKSTIKFDLSTVTGSVSSAAIQVYGAQHNDESSISTAPQASEYLIELFETNSTEWSSDALNWNTYPGEAGEAVAYFDVYNPNNGRVLNRLRAYQSHIISNNKLTDLINQRIADGATSISFTLVATATNDDFDAWVGGTFRGPELYLEHGLAPQNIPASVAVQVDSSQPDASNPDDDANDLDIQTKTDGTVIRSYLKFDVAGYTPEDIKHVTLNPYASQKGTAKTGVYSDDRFLVDLLGVEGDLSLVTDELTYNVSETLTTKNDDGTDLVLARTNIYQADRPHRILQFPEFSQQSLTDFVKEQIAGGATEVAFELTATEINDTGEGAWVAGLWRAPELTIYSNSKANYVPLEIPDNVQVGSALSPINDTWVGEAEPNANHNGEADMNITTISGDNREALLQFDISSGVSADFVTLYVRGAQQNNDDWTAIENFQVDVYGASDLSWNDAGTVWANKPAVPSETVLGSVNFQNTSSEWFSLGGEEMTNFINAQIEAGASTVTFALRGRDETPGSRGWISSTDWTGPELRMYYEVDETLSVPTFTPAAGLYAAPSVSVTIETATSDAAIYYTLDGKVPTENSTLYEGAIELTGVDGDEFTVKAITVKDGGASAIAEGVFSLGEQSAYDGTAFSLPGVIPAWKFDLGGQGISYFEGNLGTLGDCGGKESLSERRTDGALVDGCCEDGGECEIGWPDGVEWFEYTVSLSAETCLSPSIIYNKAGDDFAAAIKIETVSSSGEILRLLVDTTYFVANTEDWGVYSFDNTPLSLDTAFTLEAGTHTLRITMPANANNYTLGGLEFFASEDCPKDAPLSIGATRFDIYPNPVSNGFLNIYVEGSLGENTTMILKDLSGRTIQSKNFTIDSGLNTIQWQLEGSVKAGLYIIEIITADKRLNSKIIVQ